MEEMCVALRNVWSSPPPKGSGTCDWGELGGGVLNGQPVSVQALCVSVTVIPLCHLALARSRCTVMRRCGQAFLPRLVALPYRSPSRPVDNCRSPASKNFPDRPQPKRGCCLHMSEILTCAKENRWCRIMGFQMTVSLPFKRRSFFFFQNNHGLCRTFDVSWGQNTYLKTEDAAFLLE